MATTSKNVSEQSALSQLADLTGWHQLDPPAEDEWQDASVIGNWKGHAIRAGFETGTVRDDDACLHKVYRTSKYDVHLKIESLGRNLAQGQIKVEEAEGYGGDD